MLMTSRYANLRALLAQVDHAPSSPERDALLRELRKRVADLEGAQARTSGFRVGEQQSHGTALEKLLR